MAIQNGLDDRQLKAIELLASGETVSGTADLVGVNRKTVTEWKKQEIFKAALDEQIASLKANIEKKILLNIDPMLDKLIKIALKSDSDKTSLDAIIYAINRVVGTPTNKNQEVTDTIVNGTKVDIEIMLSELEGDVIHLNQIK